MRKRRIFSIFLYLFTLMGGSQTGWSLEFEVSGESDIPSILGDPIQGPYKCPPDQCSFGRSKLKNGVVFAGYRSETLRPETDTVYEIIYIVRFTGGKWTPLATFTQWRGRYEEPDSFYFKLRRIAWIDEKQFCVRSVTGQQLGRKDMSIPNFVEESLKLVRISGDTVSVSDNIKNCPTEGYSDSVPLDEDTTPWRLDQKLERRNTASTNKNIPSNVPTTRVNHQKKIALSAEQIDAHQIRVRGYNFPYDSRIVIEAYSNIPHASLSGYSQMTRLVLIKSGKFEELIAWDTKNEGGKFACSKNAESEMWLVRAETIDGKLLAKSNALVCPN